MFRNLDPQVIAKRRQVLEEYMTRIVVSLPSILRCELFNHFLSISDRTAAIRPKLLAALPTSEHANPMLPGPQQAPAQAQAQASSAPYSSPSSGSKAPADSYRLPPLPEAVASETNPMKAAAAGAKSSSPSSSSSSSSSASHPRPQLQQPKRPAALEGAALSDEDAQVCCRRTGLLLSLSP